MRPFLGLLHFARHFIWPWERLRIAALPRFATLGSATLPDLDELRIAALPRFATLAGGNGKSVKALRIAALPRFATLCVCVAMVGLLAADCGPSSVCYTGEDGAALYQWAADCGPSSVCYT